MSFLLVVLCTWTVLPLDTTDERYYKMTMQLARVTLVTSILVFHPLVFGSVLFEIAILRYNRRYQLMQGFLVLLGLWLYCISISRIAVIIFSILHIIEGIQVFWYHLIPGFVFLIDTSGIILFILSSTFIVQGIVFFLLNKTYCWQDFIILCIRVIYYTGINRH